MQARIVIRHEAGSKSGQIEYLPIEGLTLASLGREIGSTVRFDPDRDETVSRIHAKITVENQGRKFLIEDGGSAHGTFLNGQKIAGKEELSPGDVVELGRNVKFIFDLDPRPSNYVAKTRGLAVVTHTVKPTAKLDTPTLAAESIPVMTAPPRRITRAESPLTTGGSASKRWIPYIIGSAVLLVAVVLGGSLLTHRDTGPSSSPMPPLTSPPAQVQDLDITTQQIAEQFGDSTVRIEVKWRLIDDQTGRPVYHKQLLLDADGNRKVPLYVADKSFGIVPWLTTDDGNGRNVAVSVHATGSGFVVTDNGFILTNKHVAAGWMVNSEPPAQGYLVPANVSIEAIRKQATKDALFFPGNQSSIQNWIPGKGGMLFEPERTKPISAGAREFRGDQEILQVTFPGQKVAYDAKLVRFSPEADAALIKIESPNRLTPIELSDRDVKLGQRVVALGYPGIAQSLTSYFTTTEAGAVRTEKAAIAVPTVTDGLIANLGLSGYEASREMVIGDLGDVYQLTILATGAGNSGGPVFDGHGHAIGLFTYGRSHGSERVTFAVPIKYGKRLLN